MHFVKSAVRRLLPYALALGVAAAVVPTAPQVPPAAVPAVCCEKGVVSPLGPWEYDG